MTKKTISISYEESRLSALRLYLGQENTTVEKELTKAVDAMYGKTVPAVVQEFLALRAGGTGKPGGKEQSEDGA